MIRNNLYSRWSRIVKRKPTTHGKDDNDEDDEYDDAADDDDAP